MRTSLCIALLLAAGSAQAATTFTSSVTSANGKLDTVLTWSSDRSACVASGSPAWAGAKAASGTLTLPTIALSGTYTLTLTCSTPGSSNAVLTWTNPTTNTDGTTLTDLAKTTLRWGTSAAALTQSASVNAPAATYTVTGLADGTWYFSAASVNAKSVESAQSNVVSKVVSATATDTERVTLTVNPIPSAPAGLSVQ